MAQGQQKDETILLEFSMSPLSKGESVGGYVARSLEIIDKSGLDYRLNPMGTVIEGPWEEVLGVVKACWERMRQDCDRVSTIIKIDYRKGKTGRLNSKVESVEKTLGRKLKT
ncbi:MAG: MTH1187 family thiamine-binding protein [Candidatus Manganitrophaceae bacterium]